MTNHLTTGFSKKLKNPATKIGTKIIEINLIIGENIKLIFVKINTILTKISVSKDQNNNGEFLIF